jgi:lysine/ornithine N-monooxygenase
MSDNDFILNWKVTYKDGTTLSQVNPDGTENSYTNIDRSKLEAFQLFTEKYEKLVYTLILDPEQRLIYRRRVTKDLLSDQILYAIYLVGCQQTVNGKNIQSVSHIMQNTIVHAPEFLTLDRYTQKLIPNPVELRDDEK